MSTEHKDDNSAVAFVLALIELFVGGWAIACCWGWFLVPLGLPPVSTTHAVGLRITLALIWRRHTNAKAEASHPDWAFVGGVIFSELAMVAIAWCIQFGWM